MSYDVVWTTEANNRRLGVMSHTAVSLLSLITTATAMMSMAECPRSIVPFSGSKPFLLLFALRMTFEPRRTQPRNL